MACAAWLGDSTARVVQSWQKCKHLADAARRRAAVACSQDGLRTAAPLLGKTLLPLLTNLAIAHLRLGKYGVALAYCVALQQLFPESTPVEATCIAAHVLSQRGYTAAAAAAEALVRSASPLQPLPLPPPVPSSTADSVFWQACM